jgi:hypothetical protein
MPLRPWAPRGHLRVHPHEAEEVPQVMAEQHLRRAVELLDDVIEEVRQAGLMAPRVMRAELGERRRQLVRMAAELVRLLAEFA